MIANIKCVGWTATLALFAQFVFASTASAHAVGTSYITVEQDQTTTLQTRVDLTLRDLEFAIGLDTNGDSRITWGEVRDSSASIVEFVRQRLIISRGGEHCSLAWPDIAIDRHADEVYAALTTTLHCAKSGSIEVQSNLMFDLDDSHRTLLTVKSRGVNTITVLTANSREWKDAAVRFAMWNALLRFIGQGIWHIWIGFDHLAFLMLLLLPLSRSALIVERHSISQRLAQILKVVTAFTAAHSITLACAALGYVDFSARWTEALIAASIVVAAIANLLNRTERFGIAMAFGFGLIHGLGFASALADITTTAANRVVPLVGFNLGVEIGQLAIVAFVFPILFLSKRSVQFKQRVATVGSIAMGMLGVMWLAQRTILL